MASWGFEEWICISVQLGQLCRRKERILRSCRYGSLLVVRLCRFFCDSSKGWRLESWERYYLRLVQLIQLIFVVLFSFLIIIYLDSRFATLRFGRLMVFLLRLPICDGLERASSFTCFRGICFPGCRLITRCKWRITCSYLISVG